MAQTKEELIVKTDTDEIVLVGRPCELSAFSHLPIERHEPQERTYFNSAKTERYSHSTYDRLYHVDYGFNNKLHRCDRAHAKSRDLRVNAEEKEKVTPTLSSSVYGHRLKNDLDPRDRGHVRIAHVKTDFYRRNDINITPSED